MKIVDSWDCCCHCEIAMRDRTRWCRCVSVSKNHPDSCRCRQPCNSWRSWSRKLAFLHDSYFTPSCASHSHCSLVLPCLVKWAESTWPDTRSGHSRIWNLLVSSYDPDLHTVWQVSVHVSCVWLCLDVCCSGRSWILLLSSTPAKSKC